MKVVKLLLVTLAVAVFFTSCKQEDTPEKVMMKFANHFAAGEYTEAAAYGTASTVQLLEMMEALASVGSYLPGDDEPELYSLDDFDCTVSGATALCKFIEYGEIAEVTLIREEGKWLVDIPLDDMYDEDDWFEDEDEDWYSDEADSILN